MRPLADIAAACMLLTRLPVPAGGVPEPGAAWAWPVAGLIVGLLAGVVGLALLWLGLPVPLVAALTLGSQIIATGALHEDGLADCADGLWGGSTPQRRLEIMRDSRVGSYGVLALALSVLIRWQALALLADAGALMPALLIAGTLSRAPMAALMTALPPARSDGLSRLVGRPGWKASGLGMLVAVLVILISWPSATLPLLILSPLPALWLARIAWEKLKGQTGDILGASQQLTEIAILLTLATLA